MSALPPPRQPVPSPLTEAERRRRRRAAIRAHHPDVGGDPAELQRALAALDSTTRGRPAAGDGAELRFVRRRRRGLGRVASWLAAARRRRRRLR